MLTDLRSSLRMLRGNPGFAAAAILTLSLGIAATTTVFAWIDNTILHPYPGVSQPDELAVLETTSPSDHGPDLSLPDYRDYRDRLRQVAGLAIHRRCSFTLGDGADARLAWGELVSGNYFDVLGVKPILGRTFLAEEQNDTPNAHPVAVLGENLWRRGFQADPSIVGRTIRLNRIELTVAGVVPARFRGTVPGLSQDLWVPINLAPRLGLLSMKTFDNRGDRDVNALLRLRPGAALSAVNAEAQQLAASLAAAYPQTNRDTRASVLAPWRAHNGISDYLLAPLRLLAAVSLLVLLIVCANVANLLLARSTVRRHEFGIRLALGAGRFRIARQLLTETTLLAACGAVVAYPLHLWMSASMRALVPNVGLPLVGPHDLDVRMFSFMVLVCAASALACGLFPVFASFRAEVNDSLKEGSRTGTPSRSAHRVRSSLVVVEVALAVVALVGAGLFTRSFRNVRALSPGFDPSGVLLGRFFLENTGYSSDQVLAFTSRLRQALATTPAVRATSFTTFVPLAATNSTSENIAVPGYVPAPGESMVINTALVDTGFFETMHVAVRRGRGFTERDLRPSPPVAVVNEAFSRRYLGGADPVGRTIQVDDEQVQLVGEVAVHKFFSRTEAAMPFLYLPYRQRYRHSRELFALISTTGDPTALVPNLRAAVSTVDAGMASFHAVSLAEYTEVSIFAQKLAASLMGALGLICLALSALGLYSVMSYSVSQRVQEIGIRMAMGASSTQVLRLVMGQSLRWALAGLAAGCGIALLVTGFAGGMLVGVTSHDPLTYAASALFLLLVSAAAAWLPATRATRIDPMIALRRE